MFLRYFDKNDENLVKKSFCLGFPSFVAGNGMTGNIKLS